MKSARESFFTWNLLTPGVIDGSNKSKKAVYESLALNVYFVFLIV